MEAGKRAGACRDGTISTLELMRNPSSTHYLATAQLRAATTNPRVWDTHQTMGDLQRRRGHLENSNDPPAGLVWGCPSAEQLEM